MPPSKVANQQVWCPLCGGYTQVARVRIAARAIDVDRRTIYRYIEEGLIHAVKTPGDSYRVCTGCLVADPGRGNAASGK